MDSYDLLEKPFQENIDQFGNSLTKRKILKFWREERVKLMRQLYKEDVHTDEQFLPYATALYEQLKPLLLQSYKEEYPDRRPTITEMETWIEDCAVSCNVLDRTKDRNTWVEVWKFYRMLKEDDLLPNKDRFLI